VFLLKEYDEAEHINVGTGEEVTIAELAQRMMDAVGFSGELRFDTSKPDGTPRKVMDCSRLAALGWRPQYDLAAGLKQTYDWYRNELGKGDLRLGAA